MCLACQSIAHLANHCIAGVLGSQIPLLFFLPYSIQSPVGLLLCMLLFRIWSLLIIIDSCIFLNFLSPWIIPCFSLALLSSIILEHFLCHITHIGFILFMRFSIVSPFLASYKCLRLKFHITYYDLYICLVLESWTKNLFMTNFTNIKNVCRTTNKVKSSNLKIFQTVIFTNFCLIKS